MLAYYAPALRGVDIRTGESGTFDGNLWVGHYQAMVGQILDTITMADGKITTADPDQVLMRRAPLSAVVLQSNMTDKDSAVWRWKTQDELDADAAAAAQSAADVAAAQAAAAAAVLELEAQLDNAQRITKGLALTLLDEVNLLRNWITSFKVATASSVSLANLQTRVAALADTPERTAAQLRTAVYNKAKAV